MKVIQSQCFGFLHASSSFHSSLPSSGFCTHVSTFMKKRANFSTESSFISRLNQYVKRQSGGHIFKDILSKFLIRGDTPPINIKNISSRTTFHTRQSQRSPKSLWFTSFVDVIWTATPISLQKLWSHMYTHTHTHTHRYMHEYTHACMHDCIHPSIHTYIHAYIHPYIERKIST